MAWLRGPGPKRRPPRRPSPEGSLYGHQVRASLSAHRRLATIAANKSALPLPKAAVENDRGNSMCQMNILGAASAAHSRTTGILRPGTWCASAVGAKGDVQNRRGNSGREITALLTPPGYHGSFCPGRIWPRQGQDDASDPTWTSTNPRAPKFDHSGHTGRHPSSATLD